MPNNCFYTDKSPCFLFVSKLFLALRVANAALVDPAEVPTTPPGFTPESPITNPKTARSALAALSNALVGVYADVASVTEGTDRATAIAWAQASARDAVRWGVASQAFPT